MTTLYILRITLCQILYQDLSLDHPIYFSDHISLAEEKLKAQRVLKDFLGSQDKEVAESGCNS